jgi:hypothetical protein
LRVGRVWPLGVRRLAHGPLSGCPMAELVGSLGQTGDQLTQPSGIGGGRCGRCPLLFWRVSLTKNLLLPTSAANTSVSMASVDALRIATPHISKRLQSSKLFRTENEPIA